MTNPTGMPMAFPVAEARRILRDGGRVELGRVRVRLRSGGLHASSGDRELPSHEAYWFAWSQFNPGTQLWRP